MTKKTKEKPRNLDFRYYCDYTYDNGTPYCNCGDDYCRCSTIVNARVTDAPTMPQFRAISENFVDWDQGYLSFFLNRIYSIREIWNKDLYDIGIDSGYYGEEVGSVSIENQSKILEDFNFYNENYSNLKALVEYLLNLEYGYIIPRLKGKDYSIQKLNITSVGPGNDTYVKKVTTEYEIDQTAPIALILDGKIIDGYHRYCKSLCEGMKEGYFIVAE